MGLPAVGALFVAHLAHQDWHRLAEERAAGGTSLALKDGAKKTDKFKKVTLCVAGWALREAAAAVCVGRGEEGGSWPAGDVVW